MMLFDMLASNASAGGRVGETRGEGNKAAALEAIEHIHTCNAPPPPPPPTSGTFCLVHACSRYGTALDIQVLDQYLKQDLASVAITPIFSPIIFYLIYGYTLLEKIYSHIMKIYNSNAARVTTQFT